MRERIVKALEELRKEIDKRDEIYKHGVDLINYENAYTKAAVDLIVYGLFMMNKKTQQSEKELRDEVEWWLWEDVIKKYWKNKKTYGVKTAKSFVRFLLEV